MSKRKKAATYILDFLYVISHCCLYVILAKGLLLLMVSFAMCQTRDSRPLEKLGQDIQGLSQKDVIFINETLMLFTLILVFFAYVFAKKVYAAVFLSILLICIPCVRIFFPEMFLWEIRNTSNILFILISIQICLRVAISAFKLPSKVYTYPGKMCEVCRDAKRGAFIDEKADKWCKELEQLLKEEEEKDSGHVSSRSIAKVKECMEELEQLTDYTTFQPYIGKAVCIKDGEKQK